MHELSVALEIVRIAESEAHRAGAVRIGAIELEIGSAAGIDLAALDFAWPEAVKGSALEGAVRKVIRIQAEALCLDCGARFELNEWYDACPACSGFAKEVVRGRELRVKSLEIFE